MRGRGHICDDPGPRETPNRALSIGEPGRANGACMGLGFWELLLIAVVLVLVLGTGKLTRAMGDLARGVRNFRAEMKDEPETPPPPPVLPRSLAPPSPAVGPPGSGPDDAGKART